MVNILLRIVGTVMETIGALIIFCLPLLSYVPWISPWLPCLCFD